MLYKVTPMMAPVEKKAKPQVEPQLAEGEAQPKLPRKRRKSSVYDAEGHEVLITMMCLKCKSMKPLTMFGLRKMADGAIRNQPWCRTCRSGASTKKKPEATEEATTTVEPISAAAIAASVTPSVPRERQPAEAAPPPEPAPQGL